MSNEGVIIRVGLDGVNVTDSLKTLKNTVRASMNQMKAEMSVFNTAGDKIGALNARYSGLQRTIEAQNIQLQALTRNYQLAKEQYGENSTQARRYANQINSVVQTQEGLRQQLGQVTSELENVRREMSSLGQTSSYFNRISQQAGETAKKLDDVGKKMTTIVTLPVGGALAAGAKSFITFNQELTTMRSLLNDGSVNAATLDKEIAALGESTQKWAQKYGESTSEINQGEEELIKKGYTFNQVIGAMPSELNAARASGDDFNTVMSISTSVLEQFNLKAKDTATMTKNTQRVTDALSFVANKTAAGFEDMGTAMEYVGPVAHSVGYSLEDTAAAVGLLSNNGILADKAGTALRGAISRMLKPTNQSAKAFEAMGLSVKKMKDGFYTLPDLLDTINKNTQGMTKAQKAHLITMGFGVEAQTGMNILLSQGGDALRKLSKETQDATGYTKKLSDQMGNSAQVEVNRLKSSFQVLGQEVGKELVPELIPLVKETTNLVQSFGDLSEGQKHLIVDAGLFAASIGPVALTLGGLASTVKIISGGLGTVTGLLSKFGTVATVEAAGGAAAAAGEAGALTGALGLLTGPVGLTIAALGALGVGGYAVYKSIKNANSAMADIKPISLDATNAMMKQYDSNSKMIDSFDSLRQKSQLTDEQFMRLVDVNQKLKSSTDPKVIKDYQQEFNDLQSKSGLSNKQLKTMLDLNTKLTQKIPGATGKITEQGNRIADTTSKLKAYNSELAQKTMRELEAKLNDALAQQQDRVMKIKDLESQRRDGLKKEQSLKNKIDNYDQSAIDKEKAKYQAILNNGRANDAQLAEASRMLGILDKGVGYYQKQYSEQLKQDDTLGNQIDKLKNQNNQINIIYDKMKQVVFEENGLNYQKGRGVDYINKQIAGLKKQRSVLESTTTPNQRNTQEYRDQISKLNSQISKLNGVKSKLQEIAREAGKPVTKKVTIGVDTSQMTWQEKQIVMGQQRAYIKMKGYATGTDFAPGGYAVVGENGPEIVNLPRGAKVYTNEQSMKMLGSLTSSSRSMRMMQQALNSLSRQRSNQTVQTADGTPITIHITGDNYFTNEQDVNNFANALGDRVKLSLITKGVKR